MRRINNTIRAPLRQLVAGQHEARLAVGVQVLGRHLRQVGIDTDSVRIRILGPAPEAYAAHARLRSPPEWPSTPGHPTVSTLTGSRPSISCTCLPGLRGFRILYESHCHCARVRPVP